MPRTKVEVSHMKMHLLRMLMHTENLNLFTVTAHPSKRLCCCCEQQGANKAPWDCARKRHMIVVANELLVGVGDWNAMLQNVMDCLNIEGLFNLRVRRNKEMHQNYGWND